MARVDIQLRHGFSAGNYANAYETEDLEEALEDREVADKPEAYRVAFILGFYASYALHEISGSDREEYDEAYWSKYGKRVLKLGFMDSRQDEYEEEEEEWR